MVETCIIARSPKAPNDYWIGRLKKIRIRTTYVETLGAEGKMVFLLLSI